MTGHVLRTQYKNGRVVNEKLQGVGDRSKRYEAHAN